MDLRPNRRIKAPFSLWISVDGRPYRRNIIKLRFRGGLVWTLGLTVELKHRFRDGLVWTVSLTVEVKRSFRDELVWTVGPTVELKRRFRDGLVWTVGLIWK